MVSFKIILDNWLPGLDAATLFSLMTLEADFVSVDHQANALVFQDGLVIPFSDLFGDCAANSDDAECVFNYSFRVKQIFD